MIRTLPLVLIGASVALIGSLSHADNIPEDEFNDICKACAICCSDDDNVEVIASTDTADADADADAEKPIEANKRKKVITKKTPRTSKTTSFPKSKQAVNVKNSWLTSILYGSTISTTSLSPVSRYIVDGKTNIIINSVFTVDCTLNFNSNGEPSKLRNCKPRSKGNSWRVKEKSIPLDCMNFSQKTTCKGSYTLAFSDNDDTNETHKITLSKRR